MVLRGPVSFLVKCGQREKEGAPCLIYADDRARLLNASSRSCVKHGSTHADCTWPVVSPKPEPNGRSDGVPARLEGRCAQSAVPCCHGKPAGRGVYSLTKLASGEGLDHEGWTLGNKLLQRAIILSSEFSPQRAIVAMSRKVRRVPVGCIVL